MSLFFVNDLPDALEALTLLFGDDNTMVTPEAPEHELSQFSYCRMGLVYVMAPTDQSYQMQPPQNWARSAPWFPYGPGTTTPVTKLVKGQDNMFSFSTQCTETAKTIDLHDKARHLISLEIPF